MTRSAAMARPRHLIWERPDWWLGALAATAWVALFAEALFRQSPTAGSSHQHADHASGALGSVALSLIPWSVMVMAMMLPLARDDARWLAHRSLARRRFRTVALHAIGFVAPWIGLGALVFAVARVANLGGVFTAAVLGVAALWQLAPARRRAITRCGAGKLPRIAGFGADLDCLSAGIRTSATCLVVCGPAMVAMAIVHNLALMIGVAILAASERRPGPNPERRIGRPAEAVGLAAMALATFGVAVFKDSWPV